MRFFGRTVSPNEVPGLSARDLKRRIDRGDRLLVIDVRQNDAFEASPGLLPGAVRIPPTELPERLAEVPRDRALIFYCT